MSSRSFRLTPDVLLRAYAAGIFPMAESAASNELRWFDPPMRAVIPLDNRFHVSHKLRRIIRQHAFTVSLDTSFSEVIRSCAAPAPDRPITWINSEIVALYTNLHKRGHAHCVEVRHEDELIGGLYGVSLGSAFFGESMFSRRPNASKIALVYLVALLKTRGFTLLDTQFQTAHLAQFGTLEVTRTNYHHLLSLALDKSAKLALPPGKNWDHLVAAFLQPVTHKS